MSSHLFLGGAADGTWRDVDPNVAHWQVDADRPVRLLPDEPSIIDIDIYRLTYRRMRMAIGKRETSSLFVLVGIPDEEVYGMLLRGYRQGVPVHPPAAFNDGYERGYKAGLHEAIRIVAADNPVGPAHAWNVFRDRIKQLLTCALRAAA